MDKYEAIVDSFNVSSKYPKKLCILKADIRERRGEGKEDTYIHFKDTIGVYRAKDFKIVEEIIPITLKKFPEKGHCLYNNALKKYLTNLYNGKIVIKGTYLVWSSNTYWTTNEPSNNPLYTAYQLAPFINLKSIKYLENYIGSIDPSKEQANTDFKQVIVMGGLRAGKLHLQNSMRGKDLLDTVTDAVLEGIENINAEFGGSIVEVDENGNGKVVNRS